MSPTVPSNDAWRRIQRAVKTVEGLPAGNVGSPRRRPVPDSAPIRAILLAEAINEQPTPAAVTIAIDTNEIQRLTIVGTPTGGVFRLAFRDAWTPELSPDLSAASLELALSQLPTIGRDNVAVTVGRDNFHAPGMWLVEFNGRLAAVDVPLLQIDDRIEGAALAVVKTTIWADSGRIELVRNGIPVGTPSPLRPGAVVLCLRHPGTAGYVIHAAESRQFDPYGYPPA